ncbi:MAG: DUF4870 domain-containing protein [Kineosporiaceae bacterium]
MSYSPPPYPGAPSPGGALSPAEERQWGMLAHLITLAAWVLSSGFLGFVGALVVYLIYKDRSPFVRRHAANALNVQIIVGVGLMISIPLMFILIGFLTAAVVGVFGLVVHIVGAVKANAGESWDPPLTPHLVR